MIKTSFVDPFLSRWWWVILAIFCCFALYEQGEKKRHVKRSQLLAKRDLLLQKEEEELLRQKELHAILLSQDDSEWIESILIHRLGMIPKGSKKVVFCD